MIDNGNNALKVIDRDYTGVSVERVLQTEQVSISALGDCEECSKQRTALRKLWSQVRERAHPTHFAWHCHTCNQDTHLVID